MKIFIYQYEIKYNCYSKNIKSILNVVKYYEIYYHSIMKFIA